MRKGFTLIEVLISLLVLSILIAGFLSGIFFGFLKSSEVERKYKALLLASSSAEIILSGEDMDLPIPEGYKVERKGEKGKFEVNVSFRGENILSLECYKGEYEIYPRTREGGMVCIKIPELPPKRGFIYKLEGKGFIGARWFLEDEGDVGIYIYKGKVELKKPEKGFLAYTRDRGRVIGVGMEGEGDFSILFFNWGKRRVSTEKALIYGKL